jgi:hypothetical protein
MEIGYPTDVKHVAHIGLGTSDTSPSWVRMCVRFSYSSSTDGDVCVLFLIFRWLNSRGQMIHQQAL